MAPSFKAKAVNKWVDNKYLTKNYNGPNLLDCLNVEPATPHIWSEHFTTVQPSCYNEFEEFIGNLFGGYAHHSVKSLFIQNLERTVFLVLRI